MRPTVHTAGRYILTLVACLCVPSCIAVPVPYPAGEEEIYLDGQLLKSIKSGATTKVELSDILGPPTWSFAGGARWIYKSRTYEPSQMGACAVGMDGSSWCAPRRQEIEFADLNFDANDIVSGISVSSTFDGQCGETGICPNRIWGVTVYASDSIDERAKDFAAKSQGCAVFLFTSKPGSPDTAVWFQIDDEEQRHLLLSDTGFFRIDLVAGPQEINAVINWIEGVHPKSLRVQCEPTSNHFLRVVLDGPGRASFSSVPEATGRESIIDRRLVLMRDAPAQSN